MSMSRTSQCQQDWQDWWIERTFLLQGSICRRREVDQWEVDQWEVDQWEVDQWEVDQWEDQWEVDRVRRLKFHPRTSRRAG